MKYMIYRMYWKKIMSILKKKGKVGKIDFCKDL